VKQIAVLVEHSLQLGFALFPSSLQLGDSVDQAILGFSENAIGGGISEIVRFQHLDEQRSSLIWLCTHMSTLPVGK